MQLHARGVVLRDEVPGAHIKTKTQQVCRAGDFLVAEIDAKHGGFGLVPPNLDGAVVSSHYFSFEIDQQRLELTFLELMIRREEFQEQVSARGTTNYAAVRPKDVLGYTIPMPSIAIQRALCRAAELASRSVGEISRRHVGTGEAIRSALFSQFQLISAAAPRRRMDEVAPLVRRAVATDPAAEYTEIGIRSFGRGVFHKALVTGLSLGSKRIFAVHPGDLLFNIVFAWEGAVAVAGDGETGYVGSHRFLTCVPDGDAVLAAYVRYFFLTDEGLRLLGQASPGGAGRNRTLGLKALADIEIPVPPVDDQRRFVELELAARDARTDLDAVDELLKHVVPSIVSVALPA